MRTLRVLYQLGRADFLERARRYSFLVTLAAALYLGWAAGAGHIVLRLGDYRGVYNSAWVGGLMTTVTTTFLSLAGFYLVKNSVERDRRTGVGEILATTPMRKLHYTLGKSLSNFVFLAAMVCALAASALAMQLIRGEDARIELWTLLSPFLLIALPAMAVVASVAVLFETVPGLRGGAGNVAWFFLWSFALTLSALGGTGLADFTGLALFWKSMRAALPVAADGFSLTIAETGKLSTFVWNGVDWTPDLLASRAAMLLYAVLFASTAALSFDRFDPSRRRLRIRGGRGLGEGQAGVPTPGDREAAGSGSGQLAGPEQGAGLTGERRIEPEAGAARSELPADEIRSGMLTGEVRRGGPGGDVGNGLSGTAGPSVHLTALGPADTAFRFAPMVRAELRVLLKGARWWWLAGALGLTIAMLAAPLQVSLRILCFAWIWPVLLWSGMGTREREHGTGPIVLSSARSLFRQFPASWAAGVVLALATGAGAGARLALAGEARGLAAWLVGALFIPSLALALGVWSGTSRFFEALYTVLWYVGPLQPVPALDFMGASAAARASAVPLVYLILAAVLLAAAFAGRLRQIRN